MSVRHSLLAILADDHAHGYRLKSEFEERTAGAWSLNVGQVYTTLDRLERDGLVASGGPGEEARSSWRITDAGRSMLSAWYETPVDDRVSRDGLVLKVLVAIASEGVDVGRILQRQRTAALERLQVYTRQKRVINPDAELPALLLCDARILKTEAEVRWLDLCEDRLRQRPKGSGS